MNVAVALTDVAVLADTFEIDGTTVPERDRSYELNEWDAYALEQAVQLAEAGVVEDVLTVTIGPERSEETIRTGLAKGADRAIRVWDPALAERSYLDPCLKGRVLAAVLETEAPELVLTGVQTADDMAGATGVVLASRLGYGWAAIVTDLAVAPEDDRLDVTRELEEGLAEVATVDLPAVCTIQTGINDPRYASLRGIRMAQQTEIDVRSLADLGLDPTALEPAFSLRTLARPTSTGETELYEGPPAETAAELAAFLRDRGVGS